MVSDSITNASANPAPNAKDFAKKKRVRPPPVSILKRFYRVPVSSNVFRRTGWFDLRFLFAPL